MTETAENLDRTFAALGDRTRREILDRLKTGELGVSVLAEPFEMSQTAVSKHIRVLCDAGLVEVEKRGRTRYCRLTARRLASAAAWIVEYEAFWNRQVDNLTRHLADGDRS